MTETVNPVEVGSDDDYFDIINPINSTGEENGFLAHLKIALECRTHEIDLYWKRFNFYWLMNAAAIGGIVVLEKGDQDIETYRFIIICLGWIVSLAWFLINKSSSYWHANWDEHVHYLQRRTTGPLHSLKLKKRSHFYWYPSKPYPFSSTRITNLVSLFFFATWVGLFIREVVIVSEFPVRCEYLAHFFAGAGTICFTVLLLMCYRDSKVENRSFVLEDKVVADNLINREKSQDAADE